MIHVRVLSRTALCIAAQMRKKRTYNDQELVPLALMLGVPQLERRLPWCLRMEWASQVRPSQWHQQETHAYPPVCHTSSGHLLHVGSRGGSRGACPVPPPTQMMELLKRLRGERTLICNMVRSNFFVNATSLEMLLDQGSVQLQYTDTRLQAGKWCFSNELCQTCFLHASKAFLGDGQCDMDKHRCVVRPAICRFNTEHRRPPRSTVSIARY